MTFAEDLNEIRSYLLLPTKNYSFSSEEVEKETDGDQTNTQTATAVYSFLGKMNDEVAFVQNAQKAVELAKNLLADENFKNQLKVYGGTLSAFEENENAASFKIVNDNTPLVGVVVDKKTANVSIQSVLGPYTISASTVQETANKINEYVKANKERIQEMKTTLGRIKEELFGTVKQPGWKDLFTNRKITFVEAPEETETSINYFFTNADQEKILTLKILRENGQIEMNGQTYANVKNITGELLRQLETIDTSSAMEKMMKERKSELEAVFQEEAFQDLLKKNEFTLNSQPREEYNKLLYDVKDKQGKVVFSFVLELSSGSYKVLKDNIEIDLFGATQEDGSKKKS